LASDRPENRLLSLTSADPRIRGSCSFSDSVARRASPRRSSQSERRRGDVVLFGEERASRTSVARNNGDAHPPTIALSYVTILARMSDSECRSESAQESFLPGGTTGIERRTSYRRQAFPFPAYRASRTMSRRVETRRDASRRARILARIASLRIESPNSSSEGRNVPIVSDRVRSRRANADDSEKHFTRSCVKRLAPASRSILGSILNRETSFGITATDKTLHL